MKALPLIWHFPELYRRHVITPDSFYTVMNYLSALTNRKCSGSGSSEIRIESELVGTGRLDAVLRGKACGKALFSLKCVTEALERLLLEKLCEEKSINFDSRNLQILMSDISSQNLTNLQDDNTLHAFMHEWVAYENEVRTGKLGKTAKFWMQFIDHARLILLMLYSIKTNKLACFANATAIWLLCFLPTMLPTIQGFHMLLLLSDKAVVNLLVFTIFLIKTVLDDAVTSLLTLNYSRPFF